MRHLKTVWSFTWPYLQRYWPRLLAGVALSILFGLSNASFIWATKTLFERMDPDSITASAAASVKSPKVPGNISLPIADKVKGWNEGLRETIDPWLPLRGRPWDWRQIVGGALFLPVLVLLRGILSYGSSYCMFWVSERMLYDLRVSVLEKLNSLSLDFFTRSTTGDLLMRINTDTVALHRCMIMGFSDLLKEPVTVLFIIVSLCLVQPQLTLVAFAFVPLCVLPMQILGKKARTATKAAVGASVMQSNILVEMFAGIRVIKSFRLEQKQIGRFRELSRELIHYGMKWVQAREMVNPIIETLAVAGLGGLIVYITYTNTTVPELVGFLTGVVMCFTPIKKLASLHVMFQQTSVGVERLQAVFNEEPSVKDPVNPKPITQFQNALEFRDVSFAYGSQLIITDLNLKIPRGFKLGIAGESGSGKSTLVNLIMRFYDPVKGCVTYDGTDLRQIGVADLLSQMALVSQEIVLFDQTISENIACGKPGATQAEIEAAAKAAFAHEFILAQPEGYNTRIGERGAKLSGGQRQRVCIARAFIRNAPILLLDEATASLDSQAEAEVQTAIDRLAENRTVVSIAHRLSTLANMDKIVVVSNGRIVEEGTFKELLRKDGAFAAMARRQGIFPSAADV